MVIAHISSEGAVSVAYAEWFEPSTIAKVMVTINKTEAVVLNTLLILVLTGFE